MSSVIKRIKNYNELLPSRLHSLKWSALFESPFRFFRGTCHLFAADFIKVYGLRSGVKTWICGDLHFENFGSYKGANRLVYFDINDFDESILAIPEPELARFLTSIVIAGRQMKAADNEIKKTLHGVTGMYADALSCGKALMMESEVAHGVLKEYFDNLNNRDRQSFILDHTTKQKNKISLKYDGTHFLPIEATKKDEIYSGLKELLKQNAHFADLKFEDAAFRVAGTGSLGLQRYCVLCYNKLKDKYYLIDVKEARKSCYGKLVDIKQPKFKNEAERVIRTEYIMQYNAPDFMATARINKKWFIIKELQPLADKLSLKEFDNNFSAFTDAATSMAPLIAYAQLRSSGHNGAATAEDLMRFAGKKQWRKDLVEVSAHLADCNAKYYNTFVKSEKVKNRLSV